MVYEAREFAELMAQRVGWRRRSGRSAWDAETFADHGTLIGHLVEAGTVMIDGTGEERRVGGQFYVHGFVDNGRDVAGIPVMKSTDRLVLPDGREVTIVATQTRYDETGPHHMVLGFGQAA